MATLRDIKTRISSIKNIQQITKAMNMVAASKLRKAQGLLMSSRPYAHTIKEVIASLLKRTEYDAHDLLKQNSSDRIGVIVVTGDKGLCGSFNANILRTASKFLEGYDPEKVSLFLIGKKSIAYFKKKDYKIEDSYVDFFNDLSIHHSQIITDKIIKFYLSNHFKEVYLLYNEFKTVLSQVVKHTPLLPFKAEDFEAENSEESDEPENTLKRKNEIDYLYEPAAAKVLADLLPQYLNAQIFISLLESNASEHAARMTAMDNATTNTYELIDKLTLLFNRKRQAAITTELTEIVSGAEALSQ